MKITYTQYLRYAIAAHKNIDHEMLQKGRQCMKAAALVLAVLLAGCASVDAPRGQITAQSKSPADKRGPDLRVPVSTMPTKIKPPLNANERVKRDWQWPGLPKFWRKSEKTSQSN